MRRRAKGLLCLVPLLLTLCQPSLVRAESSPYLWPTPGNQIVTQGFARYGHEGMDIAGALGDPVLASRAGTIVQVFTGCRNVDGKQTGIRCSRAGCTKASRTNHASSGFCNYGFGNGIVIRHDDGSFSTYGHFSEVESALERGMRVEQGQTLGKMGSSGCSSGVHLHLALTQPKSGGFTKKRIDPSKEFGSFLVIHTTKATEITATSARVNGNFSFVGETPDEVGAFVGRSPKEMTRYPEYTDTELPAQPYLTMYYDIDGLGDSPLQPGTTYYWRCYAITGSVLTLGETRSFTTLKP